MKFVSLKRKEGETYVDAAVNYGCGPNFVKNRWKLFRQMIKEQGVKFWFRFWLTFCLQPDMKKLDEFSRHLPFVTPSLSQFIHCRFVQVSARDAINYCWNTVFDDDPNPVRIIEIVVSDTQFIDETYYYVQTNFACALAEVFYKWLLADNVYQTDQTYWDIPPEYLDPDFQPGPLERFMTRQWGRNLPSMFGVRMDQVSWVRKCLRLKGKYYHPVEEALSNHNNECLKTKLVSRHLKTWALKVKKMKKIIAEMDEKGPMTQDPNNRDPRICHVFNIVQGSDSETVITTRVTSKSGKLKEDLDRQVFFKQLQDMSTNTSSISNKNCKIIAPFKKQLSRKSSSTDQYVHKSSSFDDRNCEPKLHGTQMVPVEQTIASYGTFYNVPKKRPRRATSDSTIFKLPTTDSGTESLVTYCTFTSTDDNAKASKKSNKSENNFRIRKVKVHTDEENNYKVQMLSTSEEGSGSKDHVNFKHRSPAIHFTKSINNKLIDYADTQNGAHYRLMGTSNANKLHGTTDSPSSNKLIGTNDMIVWPSQTEYFVHKSIYTNTPQSGKKLTNTGYIKFDRSRLTKEDSGTSTMHNVDSGTNISDSCAGADHTVKDWKNTLKNEVLSNEQVATTSKSTSTIDFIMSKCCLMKNSDITSRLQIIHSDSATNTDTESCDKSTEMIKTNSDDSTNTEAREMNQKSTDTRCDGFVSDSATNTVVNLSVQKSTDNLFKVLNCDQSSNTVKSITSHRWTDTCLDNPVRESSTSTGIEYAQKGTNNELVYHVKGINTDGSATDSSVSSSKSKESIACLRSVPSLSCCCTFNNNSTNTEDTGNKCKFTSAGTEVTRNCPKPAFNRFCSSKNSNNNNNNNNNVVVNNGRCNSCKKSHATCSGNTMNCPGKQKPVLSRDNSGKTKIEFPTHEKSNGSNDKSKPVADKKSNTGTAFHPTNKSPKTFNDLANFFNVNQITVLENLKSVYGKSDNTSDIDDGFPTSDNIPDFNWPVNDIIVNPSEIAVHNSNRSNAGKHTDPNHRNAQKVSKSDLLSRIPKCVHNHQMDISVKNTPRGNQAMAEKMTSGGKNVKLDRSKNSFGFKTVQSENESLTNNDSDLRKVYRECSSCHNSTGKLKICQQCVDENWPNPRYYCGIVCQTKHWFQLHEKEHYCKGGDREMRYIDLRRNGTESYYDAVIKLGCGPNFVRNRYALFEKMIPEQGKEFWFRFWLNFCLHPDIKEVDNFSQELPFTPTSLSQLLHNRFVQSSTDAAISYCKNVVFEKPTPVELTEIIMSEGQFIDESYQYVLINFACALGEIFYKWLHAKDVGSTNEDYWTVPLEYLNPDFTPGELEKYMIKHWGRKLLNFLNVNKKQVPWIRRFLLTEPINVINCDDKLKYADSDCLQSKAVAKKLKSWIQKVKIIRTVIGNIDEKQLDLKDHMDEGNDKRKDNKQLCVPDNLNEAAKHKIKDEKKARRALSQNEADIFEKKLRKTTNQNQKTKSFDSTKNPNSEKTDQQVKKRIKHLKHMYSEDAMTNTDFDIKLQDSMTNTESPGIDICMGSIDALGGVDSVQTDTQLTTPGAKTKKFQLNNKNDNNSKVEGLKQNASEGIFRTRRFSSNSSGNFIVQTFDNADKKYLQVDTDAKSDDITLLKDSTNTKEIARTDTSAQKPNVVDTSSLAPLPTPGRSLIDTSDPTVADKLMSSMKSNYTSLEDLPIHVCDTSLPVDIKPVPALKLAEIPSSLKSIDTPPAIKPKPAHGRKSKKTNSSIPTRKATITASKSTGYCTNRLNLSKPISKRNRNDAATKTELETKVYECARKRCTIDAVTDSSFCGSTNNLGGISSAHRCNKFTSTEENTCNKFTNTKDETANKFTNTEVKTCNKLTNTIGIKPTNPIFNRFGSSKRVKPDLTTKNGECSPPKKSNHVPASPIRPKPGLVRCKATLKKKSKSKTGVVKSSKVSDFSIDKPDAAGPDKEILSSEFKKLKSDYVNDFPVMDVPDFLWPYFDSFKQPEFTLEELRLLEDAQCGDATVNQATPMEVKLTDHKISKTNATNIDSSFSEHLLDISVKTSSRKSLRIPAKSAKSRGFKPENSKSVLISDLPKGKNSQRHCSFYVWTKIGYYQDITVVLYVKVTKDWFQRHEREHDLTKGIYFSNDV
uniref:MYND-type domain-containing protein n=1 Tax=Strigamia maritima TaxID=126957 RepID=T1J705_STRMM